MFSSQVQSQMRRISAEGTLSGNRLSPWSQQQAALLRPHTLATAMV